MLWDNPTLDGIAATHGSLPKQTHNESVSTDLHVLSRGFIPAELWSRRVWKPDLRVVGYRNPTYALS
jgi:hypothetical protein